MGYGRFGVSIISGSVVDDAGRPISEAEVQLWAKLERGIGTQDLEKTEVTDQSGAFKFRILATDLQLPLRQSYSSLFFKVLIDGEQVADTQGSVEWTREVGDTPLVIHVSRSEQEEYHWRIFGAVVDASRNGIPGLLITPRDLEVDLTVEPVETDLTGRYDMRFSQRAAGLPEGYLPNLFFEFHWEGQKIHTTIEDAWYGFDPGEHEHMFELPWEPPEEPEDVWRFFGRVLSATGSPISALRIRVRDLQLQAVLAEGRSDPEGRYDVRFSREVFPNLPPEHLPALCFEFQLDDELIHTTAESAWQGVRPGEYEHVFELPWEPPEEPGDVWRFFGRVFDMAAASAAGVTVRIREAQTQSVVAQAMTDSEGRYDIRFTRSAFGQQPEDFLPIPFFELLRGDELLETTESEDDRPVPPGSYEKDFRVSTATEPVSPEDKEYWHVSGTVYSHEGIGQEGERIVLVDVCVGEGQRLAEGTTDQMGRYLLFYDIALIRARGKEKPDLRVDVVSRDESDRIVASSEVRYNAGPDEVLDIVIPAENLELATEYERITETMARHLPACGISAASETSFADLQEDDDRQDITYLSNKIGWDARLVAMVSLSSQYSARMEVPAELLFALFRAGVGANDVAIAGLSGDAIRSILKSSFANRIIPERLAENLDQHVKRIEEFAIPSLVEAPAIVGLSSLGELLDVSLGESPHKKEIARLYYEQHSNLQAFWDGVKDLFNDEDVVERLRVDGKLASLTLNNASLIPQLRAHLETRDIAESGDLVGLIEAGLYNAESELWDDVLTDDVPIPEEIPGANAEEKRDNYAALMANQLRLSYPTAIVTDLVRHKKLHVDPDLEEEVCGFLTSQHGKFELGAEPIGMYVNRLPAEATQPSPECAAEIERLQRVYQISSSDEAMQGLMEAGYDSAWKVVQESEATFTKKNAERLGGVSAARRTYAKAHQVHNTVLNLVSSFMLDRTRPAMHAVPTASSDDEIAGGGGDATGASGADVIAYPTLEKLFGEMDYCGCEHCRSILSPAAYLVDILRFIDRDDVAPERNPLDVLLARRPDIEHLRLSCENTNIVMPYVDLANEVLEAFVVSGVNGGTFTLAGYEGHNVGEGVTTEDLLAAPEFVENEAYRYLRDEVLFPLKLPFHKPLETLRRYFERMEVPLATAMERFRKDDRIDTADWPASGTTAFDWRDILIERLGISRQEYSVLAGGSASLAELCGMEAGTSNEEVRDAFANAKRFARRLGIRYMELVDLVKARFINPSAELLSRLERLGVSFRQIEAFAGANPSLSEAQFDELLPTDLTAEELGRHYAGDVKVWVRTNYDSIMSLIVLADPEASEDLCSFEDVEFRTARASLTPGSPNDLAPWHFFKLLRFVRLWKKLGWSIESTDKALMALFPSACYPQSSDSFEDARRKLDKGFRETLFRLALSTMVADRLGLKLQRDLLRLLALWADIDTQGSRSLYRQMFLHPAILERGPVFAENGLGGYLEDDTVKLEDHAEALQAALGLTEAEWAQIWDDLNPTGGPSRLSLAVASENPKLCLENVSLIFRYAFLARELKLSVRELIALKAMSGIDPFGPLEYRESGDNGQFMLPAVLQFIDLAQLLARSPFKVSEVLYYLRHEDLSGKSSPAERDILAFVKAIRDGLTRVDGELAVKNDTGGELARAKMALVYGQDVADEFFGLIEETARFSVEYAHTEDELDAEIKEAGGLRRSALGNRLSYARFEKRLSYYGLLTGDTREALEATIDPADEFADAFLKAIDGLYSLSNATFSRHPELQDLYDIHRASVEAGNPEDARMEELANAVLEGLRSRLKQQQIRQAVGAAVGGDASVSSLLLQDANLLHAIAQSDRPAIDDFLAVEARGLTAHIYYADDTAGAEDAVETAVENVEYGPSAKPLPVDPAHPDSAISGVWEGYIELPDTCFYNFEVEADYTATVSLSIDGETVTMNEDNGTWRNAEGIELDAGRSYALRLTVEKVKDRLALKWESVGIPREPVPAEHLYPAALVERFVTTYLKLLKTMAIADGLKLTEREVARFGAHSDYRIGEAGWINALPTYEASDSQPSGELLRAFTDLLWYTETRDDLKVKGDRLAEALEALGENAEDGLASFCKDAGWNPTEMDCLLSALELAGEDVSRVETLRRVHAAFSIAEQMGIQVEALLACATNEPIANDTGNTVLTLQNALRARYDDGAWLKLVQEINDPLRRLQRDALVAFVLHQLQQDPGTAHIDTSDKLFEWFLIDVEMDPCMKTSRIKQAISSVQLFIHRCLLNLEPRVAASSIEAERWEWMKRYRVWEANRKVFLFPENWLEPELRDDKSPFFKELESEILQGDITEDTAAVALGHYLEKLDEVAKLEICGMHYEEHDLDEISDDVIHVIARTPGARRTYYHRRADGITWSPWEKIDLDIEDNPVLPVVWKGRLFLFWVSVQSQTPQGVMSSPLSTPDGSKKPLTEVQYSDAQLGASVEVGVSLNWSERFNGKWQPPRTSDVCAPAIIGNFDASKGESFDRSQLAMSSRVDRSLFSTNAPEQLEISISYPSRIAVTFTLHNTHSLPTLGISCIGWGDVTWFFIPPGRARWVGDGISPLSIEYSREDTHPGSVDFSHPVLGGPVYGPYSIVEPRHDVTDIYTAPFFYQDPWHVFFVRPQIDVATLQLSLSLGFETGRIGALWNPGLITPIQVTPGLSASAAASLGIVGLRSAATTGLDPKPILSAHGPNIRYSAPALGTVSFGATAIGPGGSFDVAKLKQLANLPIMRHIRRGASNGGDPR